jgi:hypothetical protein
MLVPTSNSAATSATGFPKPTRATAWALNSAVYRFLVTDFIVAYSSISWSRILAHLTVKRLKELEKENGRLKKLVADLSLDKAILKEIAEGKW